MSNDTEIKRETMERMTTSGVPYEYVHMTEGRPVVIVSPETLADLMWRHGVDGRFVARDVKGKWSYAVIEDGAQVDSQHGLSECCAYRGVLGYAVGRARMEGRYKGYYPQYHLS